MSATSRGALRTRSIEISHGGARRSFQLFDTKLGYETCQRVLSGKAYPLLLHCGEVKTIVDIGANVGSSTVYFALRFPGAKVFAFEPSPESFALLVANTADLPNVFCFPYGLFAGERQATLFQGKDDPVTSSIGQSPEVVGDGTSVFLRDAATALKENKISEIGILKIDTEGCELPILRSLAEYLAGAGVIFLEFHSERDRQEIDRLLIGTHTLFRAEVNHPCRGELCYVARRHLPAGLDEKYGIRV